MVHNSVTNTHVQLPYPTDVGGAILNGHAFHHGRFVMGLRKLAQEEKWCVCVRVCMHVCVCACTHVHVCACGEQVVSMPVIHIAEMSAASSALSVKMIEGTVTSLLEKDGSIVGVTYRSKTSENHKVRM